MTDWSAAKAPDLETFTALSESAWQSLPEQFRMLCADIVIEVADFPSEEILAQMGCQTEFDLLGLFEGTGLAHASAMPESGVLPNRIWLYRRPILDYWAEHDEALGTIVTHVLIHEIGHHFGLSDADMEALEASIA